MRGAWSWELCSRPRGNQSRLEQDDEWRSVVTDVFILKKDNVDRISNVFDKVKNNILGKTELKEYWW